ncbi:MAG: polynucleotide kinase-phosphatase [Myxococcales bacterium]|nr:polynucleotide kinase-phosphatase [Myxococcales bacterium]
MKLAVPELSLIALVGASGSGKSTFAGRHFKETEVLSSDYARGLVSDDENDMEATKDAFDVLYYIARKRLERGLLTVIDATNVQREARQPIVSLARELDVLPVAIVLNPPREVCEERTKARPDRDFGLHVVRKHCQDLKRSLKSLKREGFRRIHVLDSVEEIDGAEILREPLWNNRKHEQGPFDVIGDVHGCADELEELLSELGYIREDAGVHRHPEARRVVFVGDLADRGPGVTRVLRTAMDMVKAGSALCIIGNHEAKLLRKLRGKNVRLTHGLAQSVEQLEAESEAFRAEVLGFLDGLISHFVFDEGRLVVAHAGLKETYQGRASARVREFALYGDTSGETDEYGLPVRHDWASEYRGKALVVYGHTPVVEATWVNRTICIDTGCVFGGALSALRYPERELLSVPAKRMYYEPIKPLRAQGEQPAPLEPRPYGDLLDIEDVCGKRVVVTRDSRAVRIREEHAAAALEVMSRFAVDPRWLIYLPPTMSPTSTVKDGPLLEHPGEAFEYYRSQGVSEVVCEEKHMGSRAVVVVTRNAAVAQARFGSADGRIGVVYTRTGRPFFSDALLEAELLSHTAEAIGKVGLWDELKADWLCLDAEFMPWPAKAQELLRTQYAAVGSASRASLADAVAMLERTARRDAAADDLLMRYREKLEMAKSFTAAYRQYCWPVASLSDFKLAPFHLLAAGGCVFVDRDHVWHMEKLARLAVVDPELFRATPFKTIDVNSPDSQAEGTAWWQQLTSEGGEGMVVKPRQFVVRGKRGLVQPAVKCRGPEYLRIIYGPEYTAPENLERLRARGLGRKRALALQEFALGLEGLQRFVEGEQLHRVHECVFGVLALESEPVDPRL